MAAKKKKVNSRIKKAKPATRSGSKKKPNTNIKKPASRPNTSIKAKEKEKKLKEKLKQANTRIKEANTRIKKLEKKSKADRAYGLKHEKRVKELEKKYKDYKKRAKKGWGTRRGNNALEVYENFLADFGNLLQNATTQEIKELISDHVPIEDSDFLGDAITTLAITGEEPSFEKISEFAKKYNIPDYYAWEIWRRNYDEDLGFEGTEDE